MGTIFVDNIKEHSASNGVHIPGHIIQTVHTSTNTQVQTSSSGFIETGLNLSITPKYSNSKILVTV